MRLKEPDPNLRVSVVVPAHDEEELVEDCLRALAVQEGVSSEEYEVLLVLDNCKDDTDRVARSVATAYPHLRLHFLEGPGRGSGPARRTGMEAACERLLRVGRPHGLIASTDADTVVAPDWLEAQLDAASRGAVAIGGRIELSDDGLPEHIVRWHSERGRLRQRELLRWPGRAEHWQFSGASLALTAAVYRDVGGLEPRSSLEDEHLERVLRQRDIPIERLLSVRVTTSARLVGRASRGLAHDLALVAERGSGTGHQQRPGG